MAKKRSFAKLFNSLYIESCLGEDLLDQIKAIDEQMKLMQQELLSTDNFKNAGDELGMEIRKLREEK